MSVQLCVLGSPLLRRTVGGKARDVHVQPKRLALLAYLAVASPLSWCRRESLVGLFWPDLANHHARNALNQAIHELRVALGDAIVATRGNDEIRVPPGSLWCDAGAFEGALIEGCHEKALSLYRGPLLDGVVVDGAPEFDAWVRTERERLRVLAADAASILTRLEQARGSTARCVRWLRRLLDLSPDDEAAIRQLMTIRRSLGDRVGALRDYQEFERRLSRELDVAPAGETRALASLIKEEQNAGVRAVTPDSPGGDAYWRGLIHWSRRTPEDMRKAAFCFREAMGSDPACCQACAAFAMAGMTLGAAYYDVEPPDRVYPDVKSAVNRALEIDGNHPVALASRAVALGLYDRNWREAEETSLRACVIAPHDPVVHHARAVVAAYTGRIEEALSSIGRAARLEPLVLAYQEIEGFYLYLARRPRRAARHLERLLEIEPRLYLARMGLGHARAALGEAQEAAAAYRCAMQATGAHPYPLASLGVLFASTSRPRDAAAVLAELAGWSSSRYVRPTYIAAIHAALGSHDAAFAALARAIDEHDIHVTSILADPIYDPVRGDRRFRPLVQRMGLHSVSVGVRE